MSSNFDKFQKRRLISSYFSVVLSVFLVLFLLGVLGLFIINSKQLADDFKEKIAMTVFFKNEANDSIIKAFNTELKRAPFAKSFVYVTKEKAAKEHTDIIGEDFLTFLGENPLLNSYDIHLKADYVERDSIVKIESNFRKNAMISDIVYDKQLVNLVNDNIRKVSMWILIISGFLTVIAVLLINSSLRLSIHSNRFIIKTMQMVGATKAFIRKPFVMRSVKLGMLGAGLAIIALIALLLYVDTNFPGLGILEDKALTGLVLVAVFGLGVLITWVSTHFATQRFLNLRTDDLY
ncbi:MAG: permease-like cell division protein FtsX [Flavobacterium nitrogenifigens]|jgi:cell division transport system permease protein|uniref:Cell division protein FtsX n=1 Tax=Flavobacterium nitrogenifigens TaxID=1617283 RepID=A0A521D5B7_9FLAO|nr:MULTISPECIES: permease-like cell division protein FtsX [Flavobacterium]EJG01382.1 cell division protein FtsX [Flavobacterium sp. F52]KAF2337293.1 FtsX-like permease family protein [Flavobacterium nitrogenifigens]MDQ8010840.1 permease-like cell division protein FtsX [Flavobacterium nitrogenifigens]MXO06514.1 ABC transporter permease [Flavobacterium sp. HBTb2-11-1]SMO66888.1 cell division protein FtsX [Flavobacterium nitrogenifigens]